MMWLGWFACGFYLEEPVKSTQEQSDEHLLIQPTSSTNLGPSVLEGLEVLAVSPSIWTNTRTCVVTASTQETPSGWMFYAWNHDGSIGMVVSIHSVEFELIPVGQSNTLFLEHKDAFVLVELGSEIPSNFCVTTFSEIPVANVLESQSGRIDVTHTTNGWQVSLSEVRMKEQYGDKIIKLPDVQISTGSIQIVQ